MKMKTMTMERMMVALAMATVLVMPSVYADETYVMRVDGLVCPYCAYGVEKLLKARDEVDPESIDVRLEDGLVTVNLRQGRHLDDATLAELMSDAGFTLRSVERSDDQADDDETDDGEDGER
jgi:copper chaperone